MRHSSPVRTTGISSTTPPTRTRTVARSPWSVELSTVPSQKALHQSSIVIAGLPRSGSTLLANLPENLQSEVKKALQLVKNDFASTRYQAMKFGEWRRDSALLNYNRRTNFDNYLGHVAPFAFWGTSSMFQWGVESIDRPAMLTNYLRAEKLMATNGLERDGMATRTKGKIRIDPLITHTLPLERINDAFELMHRGESIRSVIVY